MRDAILQRRGATFGHTGGATALLEIEIGIRLGVVVVGGPWRPLRPLRLWSLWSLWWWRARVRL